MPPSFLCSCCNQRLLDAVTYEWDCDAGHIHTDTYFGCPDCDNFNVEEIAARQAFRLA